MKKNLNAFHIADRYITTVLLVSIVSDFYCLARCKKCYLSCVHFKITGVRRRPQIQTERTEMHSKLSLVYNRFTVTER